MRLVAGTAAAVLAASCALAGCSSDPPRDDRGRVRAAIAQYAREVSQAGMITGTPPAPVFSGCGDDHTADVQWAADAVQQPYPADVAQGETEKNLLARALGTGLRLDTAHEITGRTPPDPMDTYATEDGRTRLFISVPRGQYVRIDGIVSC